MEFVNFGRTNMRVSVAALGCGGHSRLGQSQGASVEHSVKLIHAALDLGVNFIDTAAGYKTEDIVGQAMLGRRDAAFISTKAPLTHEGKGDDDFVSPAQLRASLEESLVRLKTDYVDVFYLHGLKVGQYEHCRAHFFPEMEKMRDEGKVRFFGVSEAFIRETDHDMLKVAVREDFWDVMMVGFNMLNPSARQSIFPATQKKNIATLGMFAVRKALSNPEALAKLLQGLHDEGALNFDAMDRDNPLGFLLESGDASSIANAAYRFCRHEAGLDVVLTGTGKIAHLEENVASILQGPLHAETCEKLRDLFGHINSVSGN